MLKGAREKKASRFGIRPKMSTFPFALRNNLLYFFTALLNSAKLCIAIKTPLIKNAQNKILFLLYHRQACACVLNDFIACWQFNSAISISAEEVKLSFLMKIVRNTLGILIEANHAIAPLK